MNNTRNSNIRKKAITTLTILAIIAILTTSLLGITFAKYINNKTFNNKARVAKWQFNTPATIELFKDSYINDTDKTIAKSIDGKNIVAPGTSGEYSFEISNDTEVAYKLSSKINANYSENWTQHSPIKFSLDSETWHDLNDFISVAQDEMKGTFYADNNNNTLNYTIYWQWPFENSVIEENNQKDTELGILATQKDLEVLFEMELTAEQII